jgi:kynurenine formamidase
VRILDLSQPLGPETSLWPGSQPFSAVAEEDYGDYGFWSRHVGFPEHSGTHLDAPIHRIPGGAATHEIAADRLVRPAVRIDARGWCGDDRRWTLEAGHVEAWEAEHGRVPEGCAVLLCTGWDRFLGDFDAYLGDPPDFPGYGASATALLVERGVAGIGIDTVGVDAGSSEDSPTHTIALGAGLWHLEGLVGLDAVPATGATLVAGAVKLVGGSGVPARVFALGA